MKQILNERHWILISDRLPDPGEAHRFVSRKDCGAVNLFSGVTRNHEKGKKVSLLFYDCYEEMAASVLQKLIADIQVQFPVGKVAVLHKTGEVPVGHLSMIVAVASAHRVEAIQATLELINRLKREVPIWKRETFEDGEKWKEEQP
ncbi:MAG: molybdenum cofactor biosynthesis protein MoaE [Balneolales bacterium]